MFLPIALAADGVSETYLDDVPLPVLIRLMGILGRAGYKSESSHDSEYHGWNGLVWQVAIWHGLMWEDVDVL